MSTNNGNFFGLSIPGFNVPNLNFGSGNMGGAGFSLPGATNQIQQNMAQAFSPEALYEAQFNNGFGGIGGGKQPGGWFEGLDLGLEDLATGAGIINGIGSTWLGMQQYGLAKDSFNFNKGLATQNYENQAQLTNRALEASLKRNARHNGMSKEEAVTQGMDRWGVDEQVGG